MELFVRLQVITPEKIIFDDDVVYAIFPTESGCFEVIHGHSPLVSILETGTVSILTKDKLKRFLAVSKPYIDVNSDKIILVADTAEFAEHIDIDRSKDKINIHERSLKDGKKADKIINSILKHKVRISTVEKYVSQKG